MLYGKRLIIFPGDHRNVKRSECRKHAECLSFSRLSVAGGLSVGKVTARSPRLFILLRVEWSEEGHLAQVTYGLILTSEAHAGQKPSSSEKNEQRTDAFHKALVCTHSSFTNCSPGQSDLSCQTPQEAGHLPPHRMRRETANGISVSHN